MTDTIAPKVIEINPKIGSAEVYIFSNIIFSFDKIIQRGVGDITLSKSDGSIIEKFTPQNSGVTINGKNLTINPAVNLSYGEKYLINIPSAAITDTSGNNFLGLPDYEFTVAPKQHIFNITGRLTAGTNTARLYFSANVADGSAALDFEYGSNGWVAANNTGIIEWREVDLNYNLLSTIILSRVPKINPPLSASGFINLFSNTNSIDINAIDIVSASPADEAINVGVKSNIQITFDRPIERGVGNIILKTSDGTTVATYEQNSSNVTISSSMLTIDPTADLNYNTSYRVEFASSSIQDLAGNDYAGTTSYNFTTNFIPSATATTITTDEDTAKTGTLAGTDDDGNTLTFAKVADPSHGTVSINATTGAYTYTPALNYNGSDSFTFKVNDGTVDSAVATVSITITSVTDISGHVYHWKNHSLIQGVEISNGTVKTTTDTLGNYQINASDLTSEVLSPTVAVQSLGNAISSADALAALKIAVGRNPNADGSAITPYQFIAADVNQDGKVTSADALAILKMAVKRSDAPANKWLFVSENQDFWNEATNSFTTTKSSVAWDKLINVNTQADVSANLVAVLKGDVNGDWSPPANSSNIDLVHPNYFTDLSTELGYPQSQWGIVL